MSGDAQRLASAASEASPLHAGVRQRNGNEAWREGEDGQLCGASVEGAFGLACAGDRKVRG